MRYSDMNSSSSSIGNGFASPGGLDAKSSRKSHNSRRQSKIYDDKAVIHGYESVPLIELDTLPRGGISLDTAAVGRIQVCYCYVSVRSVKFSLKPWIEALHTSTILYSSFPSILYSLEFRLKPLKIVCYLVWKFLVFILYRWNDSVERWARPLELIWPSLSFLLTLITLSGRSDVRW
jgi:hypothetical protein